MATDSKSLQRTLFGIAISILMALGGCVGKDLLARVSTLEKDDIKQQVESATVKQEIRDFKADFDDFKKQVSDDIALHHKK